MVEYEVENDLVSFDFEILPFLLCFAVPHFFFWQKHVAGFLEHALSGFNQFPVILGPW